MCFFMCDSELLLCVAVRGTGPHQTPTFKPLKNFKCLYNVLMTKCKFPRYKGPPTFRAVLQACVSISGLRCFCFSYLCRLRNCHRMLGREVIQIHHFHYMNCVCNVCVFDTFLACVRHVRFHYKPRYP